MANNTFAVRSNHYRRALAEIGENDPTLRLSLATIKELASKLADRGEVVEQRVSAPDLETPWLQTFEVTFIPEGAAPTEVKAHADVLDGGALCLLDRKGELIVAFGPGAWFSYKPVRGASAQ